MERVCIYLRKSRADLEAEAHGEGETLAKHKKALLRIAKQQSLNIVKIREEIVSGESLMHRPEMLETLKEVESGQYDGVLCMDMDRLGRGNMQEQGLILETFRKSNTKIITPRKVYDLNNEMDEEWSEFESFMARRELKIITRRLQGGRVRSVEEGNYIGTRPPYGYQIHKTDHERILVPHPEQAPVVQLIFEWYTHDDPQLRKGTGMIANELNRLMYKSYTGKAWIPSSVLNILKNAVYAGRIQWKKKEQKKSLEAGKKRDTRTRPTDEWIDVEGKHEPIISIDIYLKAKEILKNKYHVPYQLEHGITNPLAGLVRCDMCGSSMVYRPYTKQQAHLMCYNRFCQNKSSRFAYVEEKMVSGLREWLGQYKAEWGLRKKIDTSSVSYEVKEAALKDLERELLDIETQKSRLHDFLERGIYDESTYLERSKQLAERIEKTKAAVQYVEQEQRTEKKRQQAQSEVVPKVEHVLDLYHKTDDPAAKNVLLKLVLDVAKYRKEKYQKDDDFTLILYPKLPR